MNVNRTLCWSLQVIPQDQDVFIVTDPRLIQALLVPQTVPNKDGSYGPYVDGALITAEADPEPGIYRGKALTVSSPKAEPFLHEVVRAEVNRSKRFTLTGPEFAKGRKRLDDLYERHPWLKPPSVKRGESPLHALLAHTLGDDTDAFLTDLDIDDVDGPAKGTQDFLGIVMPENDLSTHLLSVVYDLSLKNDWAYAQIELKNMSGRI
ncbi:MAG: hypothetical protein RLZZ324_115 [Candidatus Parcubacteria bacterium]